MKIRGFRVDLLEVEHVVREAADGAAVAAIPWPRHAEGAESVVAFVAGDAQKDRILSHCRELLPEYMVPRSIRVVEELPMTPNGKVDRVQLHAWLKEH